MNCIPRVQAIDLIHSWQYFLERFVNIKMLYESDFFNNFSNILLLEFES